MPRARNDRQPLTAEGFAELLARLDPDVDEAGREYERLRRSLVRFFDWRGAWPPDECADDCLDRLARRLAERVPIIDVRQFAQGIARLVLLERHRQPMMSSINQLPDAALAAPPTSVDDGTLVTCFERCLSSMPADHRALVVGYYEGERDRKIANRRRLATSMGLSENALRSRVQRLRDRLEDCIRTCRSVSERGSS